MEGLTIEKHLGLHETLEVHELLTFKNLVLTKATLMSGLAQDQELKGILSNQVDIGIKEVQRLNELLTTKRGSQNE